MVYRLSKALYGLGQAPRAWNIQLDKSLKEHGFTRCSQEQAVYTRGEGDAALNYGKFEMNNLGFLWYYLGIEVEQKKGWIKLKQSAYAKKILSQFGMAECNATKYPIELKLRLHKDSEGVLVDAI
ncbi:Copia protein-like protein [Drosera capensis]